MFSWYTRVEIHLRFFFLLYAIATMSGAFSGLRAVRQFTHLFPLSCLRTPVLKPNLRHWYRGWMFSEKGQPGKPRL